MNFRVALGALLVALPFLGMGVFCVKFGGWRMLAGVFAVTALIAGSICGGAYLIGAPLQ